jgi:hypothetical protein
MSAFLGAAGSGDMGDVTSANNFPAFRGGANIGDVKRVNGQGPESPFQVKLTFSRLAENDRM